MKEIRFFKTEQGNEPFRKWLNKIKDNTALALINNRIKRLSLGYDGDYKRVAKNVFEIRIHYGPGYRVYFSFQNNEIIILLLGGNKSSQKKDIKFAEEYLKSYKERFYEKI